jgi:hypothetical protein
MRKRFPPPMRTLSIWKEVVRCHFPAQVTAENDESAKKAIE